MTDTILTCPHCKKTFMLCCDVPEEVRKEKAKWKKKHRKCGKGRQNGKQ